MVEKKPDLTCEMMAEFSYQDCKNKPTLTLEYIEVLELDKDLTILSKPISRKHTYKPLSERTKTFEEIKKYNDGENLENTRQDREAYEDKINQYK